MAEIYQAKMLAVTAILPVKLSGGLGFSFEI
jgi:hypothetical protein